MKVRGIEVPVNILDELEPHLDRFVDYRIRGDKLQSKSPFRYENHPSFAVNLENGTWVDSGSPTEDHYKGNFISLLAYLRQETYNDTEEYLLQVYNVQVADCSNLSLKVQLNSTSEVITFNWRELPNLHFRHPYLARRGISEEVQRLFCIGYDREREAVAMPWINVDKSIINIKYRSVHYKQFFYQEGGQLTRYYVYGLWQCIKKGYTDIAIVESEIDCMYLWSCGIPAVALGHAGITQTQVNLLIKAGIRVCTIATDNDDAGNRFADKLKRMLPKYFTVYEIDIPQEYKDVNEIQDKQIIKEIIGNRRYLELFTVNGG